ncbi:DUF6884 domain-containing protein [Natronosalvus halobius]|uniref:DUF6884 domain-containing protein n=1 Tax=Natronosalvus halobius TaxID=2953746 RepID=UPI00209EB071|nr:DUF6884 domain-containing protein [Natronosalvus halobius]USZ73756.1 hypothetical protein NGM15_18640 [Natronosalvus halobius]
MTDVDRTPTPREHELSNGDLAVSSHWVWGVRDATVVPNTKRPLYRLLMRVLEDAPVPDCMPARLATACTDLVDVKDAVENIDRGSADIGGVGWGMGHCYRVRDAIEAHRDRDPITLVAVGCSGTKDHADEPLPSKERYAGGYWTNKRQYGETVGDDWRVISAEHALLEPDAPIEYYETHVTDLDGIPVDHDGRLPNGEPVTTLVDLWAYNVHNELARWLEDAAGGIDPRDVRLEVLLGKDYENRLRERDVFDVLRIRGDLEVAFPFREVEGLTGIGKQRQWMAGEVAASALATDGGEPQ